MLGLVRVVGLGVDSFSCARAVMGVGRKGTAGAFDDEVERCERVRSPDFLSTVDEESATLGTVLFVRLCFPVMLILRIPPIKRLLPRTSSSILVLARSSTLAEAERCLEEERLRGRLC